MPNKWAMFIDTYLKIEKAINNPNTMNRNGLKSNTYSCRKSAKLYVYINHKYRPNSGNITFIVYYKK
jgi:predicted solute-binding protein